jgi:hypothetical protein
MHRVPCVGPEWGFRSSSKAVAPDLTAYRARSRSECESGGFPFEDPSPRHITGRVLRDTGGWGLRERRPYVQAEGP